MKRRATVTDEAYAARWDMYAINWAFAEAWANDMEQVLARGASVSQAARTTFDVKAACFGFTGRMSTMDVAFMWVVCGLYTYWEHGPALRKWIEEGGLAS